MKFAQKRIDLINYFKNEDKKYSVKDVLQKEFAMLKYSSTGDFLDLMTTPYDSICEDVNDFNFDENVEEFYIKGVVVDVDNRKGYSIIHILNGRTSISISCSEQFLFNYNEYLNIGEIVIFKCHTYNSKVYAHFLINTKYPHDFYDEERYISRESHHLIDDTIRNKYVNPFGLVCQCTYFVSKKGTQCMRLLLYTKDKKNNPERKTVISCKNSYNTLPTAIKASDFIEYEESSGAYVNNIVKVKK